MTCPRKGITVKLCLTSSPVVRPIMSTSTYGYVVEPADLLTLRLD